MRPPTFVAMPSEARVCAHAVTRRVFEQGAYADRAFHSHANGLSGRERALAMQIAYGAIQRAATLDVVIEGLTERPADRLDAAVTAALRTGLYELLYLDGTAAHAVVDDSVELVKMSGSHGHGLVNAALRRAAREGGSLLAGLSDETAEGAARMHSHPAWLAEMWWEQLGAERARALMAVDNAPRERAIRVNTLVANRDEIATALAVASPQPPRPLHGVELDEALVLTSPIDLLASPQWREGEVIAQSRAAMLVARALAPEAGERVLDLCAAPGGKSTHIAALMGGLGEVVAVERDETRARQLKATVERMRTTSVKVHEGDAEQRLDGVASGSFDRVLLDAPCSGLGTLQARPDLRWRMSEERIVELVAIQARMLANAANAVAAGGTLVYSTCTISEAENEQQIEALLQSRPDFAVEPLNASERYVTTLPSEDGTAGFFIARLRLA
jgi:16S rRNA (cytosine967-C5)-methyltransferase